MRPAVSRRHDRTHDVVTTTPRMADGHEGETAVIGQQLTEPLVAVVSDDGQVSLNQVRDGAIGFGAAAVDRLHAAVAGLVDPVNREGQVRVQTRLSRRSRPGAL